MSRWPNPNYTRIIDRDPQIVSVGRKETFDWGARASILPKGGDPQSTKSGQAPSAPEMTIRHVKGS